MTMPRPGPAGLNRAGQHLIRFVIAGYFIATALGVLPGAGLVGLTGRLLPDVAAQTFATAITIVLSVTILVGYRLRAAALTLSLLMFWSSYLTVLDLGLGDRLGQFWRDLALLAALLLTTRDEPGMAEQSVVGRLFPATAVKSTTRIAAWRSARGSAKADDDVTNIFDVTA